jgi:hypothetical protein
MLTPQLFRRHKIMIGENAITLNRFYYVTELMFMDDQSSNVKKKSNFYALLNITLL